MTSIVRRSRHAGFTLLEVVVVLCILAALAGLLIPRLDFLRRSSDTATAASGMGDVMSNLQLHRTVKGTYPNQFDSLLETPVPLVTGAPGTAPLYSKLFNHPNEPYESYFLPDYTGAPGSDQSWLSYLHLIGPSMYDHSPTATFASDSGTSIRTISTAGPTFPGFWVARVKTTGASSIVNSIYPDGVIPAGVTLVVQGIGPRCTAVGSTMQAPPIYSGIDPETYYSRFLAVFAVYASGKRCELKAVVDPTGSTLNAQIGNYYKNQPD